MVEDYSLNGLALVSSRFNNSHSDVHSPKCG
jgi:hypothetical protein